MYNQKVIKIIFVDLSQTIISVLMQHYKDGNDLRLARAMVFQALASYRKKFGAKYGEIVLAYDARSPGVKTWRKEKYPWYKSNRNDKFKDPVEAEKWRQLFEHSNALIEEFKNHLTWKVVGSPGAEADDVIGVLVKLFGNHENTLIISSDGDFPQLQRYSKVAQYSAIQKKFIKVDNPLEYLHMKILTGDKGDGIPNILSPETSFVDKIRQKSVTEKISEEWRINPVELKSKYSERYKQNRELIDFEFIPDNIQQQVIKAYEDSKPNTIQELYKFFVANKMVRILEEIDQFKTKPGSYTNATNLHSNEDFFDGGAF